MSRKYLMTSVLALALLIVAFIPLSDQVGTYDPWSDINGDGKIDGKDIASIAKLFGTLGMPLTKASVIYDSGWIDITDKRGQYFNITHNLNSTDIMVGIQGKTTVDGEIHQKDFGGTGYAHGWERTYGGPGDDWLWHMIQTADGGYALAGYTDSYGAGLWDFWLVKTDSSGNKQWDKTYGGADWDFATSLVQTTDGGYALAGCTEPYGSGNSDFLLVRTDASGNMVWSRTFGGTENEKAYSLVETTDGGYAIAGYTNSSGAGDIDFYLVRTDSTGSEQWSRTYGGTYEDIAYCLVQTADGGYTLVGTTKSLGSGSRDFWLVKTDSSGNKLWDKTYGAAGEDVAASLVQTADGGYALAGYTDSYGAGLWDFWLVKTDASGNMEWNKTLGGTENDNAVSLIQTADGGYALAGCTSSYGAGQYDFWLVRTDSIGNRLWDRTYGGTSNEYAPWGIVETTDHGYVLAGSTSSFGAGSNDFYMVKTAAESGLAWTDSTANTITLYRGETDLYWNYVRVRISEVKESP